MGWGRIMVKNSKTPMYDWKAGDATGEGTYYERKMTTAYGMRCVKE